jgi:hypothetical protein
VHAGGLQARSGRVKKMATYPDSSIYFPVNCYTINRKKKKKALRKNPQCLFLKKRDAA